MVERSNIEPKSWQVGYPEGVIKYIDAFREKYFQYDIFDNVVKKYAERNILTEGRRILSLGSGTGRHEVELSKMGYEVIGLERNEESIGVANKYIEKSGANVKILKCDFLDYEELNRVMKTVGTVDIVLLLLIPISVYDYCKAIKNTSGWLRQGGLFITDNFGYSEEIDKNRLTLKSDVEVVSGEQNDDFIVRLNYYEYKNDIVNWDAIYLYNNKMNQVVMKRDHDVLEVVSEDEIEKVFNIDKDQFEQLDTYRIVECDDALCPPLLYEYLLGWRKK